MTKKKYYINNQEFYDEVVKSQNQGQITERLGQMFMLLSERNVNHRDFVRYPYREDLISVGTLACVQAFPKFDIDKFDNPFAFFTSCIRNALKQYIKKDYKQQNIYDAIKVDNGLNPSYAYHDVVEGDDQNDE